MNVEGIINICNILGLSYSEPRDGGSEERGPQISLSCPLAQYRHGDAFDQNRGCSVSIVEKGPSLVRCFSGKCGFKGTWLRLLQTALAPKMTPDYEKLLEEVAKIEALTLQARVERNYKIIEKTAQIKTIEIDDKDVVPESKLDRLSKVVPPYAIKRGIATSSFERWGLCHDEFLKRLVFPARRRDGKLVGLQGRDVTGLAERPHHNYEGFNRQRYLLGEHLIVQGKPLIIVEGSVGTVKTDQAMFPIASTVGTLGEGFSKWHADTVAEANPSCVYICTDGDAPGRAMASRIEYSLHGRIPMRVMECPTDVDENGKKVWDTGNLPPEHIKFMFEIAKTVLDRIKWCIPLPTHDGNKWIVVSSEDNPASSNWQSRRFCGSCEACVSKEIISTYGSIQEKDNLKNKQD
jgi:5S rRNA maturation endonuclease (ribonuclease M5)